MLCTSARTLLERCTSPAVQNCLGGAAAGIHDSDIKDHRAKAPPAQPSKETIFSALDVDGSGELGKEELVEVLAAWGVPRREAERCFTDLDTNADGVW